MSGTTSNELTAPAQDGSLITPGMSGWDVAKTVGLHELGNLVAPFVQGGELLSQAAQGRNILTDPSMMRETTNVALGLAGESGGLPLRPSESLGTFGGVRTHYDYMPERGYTLDDAVDMEAEGHTPVDIHSATGWHRGVDGKWRTEISDKPARWNVMHTDPYNVPTVPPEARPGKLGDLLDHPELFDAYPHLKDIAIHELSMADIQKGLHGYWDAAKNTIAIKSGLDPDLHMDTLMHEIQHAIQYHEGFARGGMPEEFLPHDFDKQYADTFIKATQYYATLNANNIRASTVLKGMKDPGGDFTEIERNELAHAQHLFPYYPTAASPMNLREFQQLEDKLDNMREMKNDAFEEYKRLAGEVESKLVEERRGLASWQLQRHFPPAMEGYPTEHQRVLGTYEKAPRVITFPKSGFQLEPVEYDPTKGTLSQGGKPVA